MVFKQPPPPAPCDLLGLLTKEQIKSDGSLPKFSGFFSLFFDV